MKLFSAITLVFAIALIGSAHADEDDAKSKLVGFWEVLKSDEAPAGSSVEFTGDGRLILIPKGKEDKKIVATYKVEGKKLTTTRKEKDREEVNILTIKTLNEKTLITLNDKGKSDELKRVKR